MQHDVMLTNKIKSTCLSETFCRLHYKYVTWPEHEFSILSRINEIMYIGGHQMSSCKGKAEGSILKILTQYKQLLIEFSLWYIATYILPLLDARLRWKQGLSIRHTKAIRD